MRGAIVKKAPTHRSRIPKAPMRRVTPKVSWYNTARWKRLRKRQLSKEPLCGCCKSVGITESATIADHIDPHKGDYEKFFDPDNLQSLCVSCHNSKTAKQDGGFGK